jgi:mono/diheme cytochrome c family protein
MARQISMGGAPAVTLFAAASVGFSVLLFLFAYLLAYKNPRYFSTPLAFLFLTLGLMSTGVTEWVREAVRKPYVIYGYMYSNGLRVKDLREWPVGESLLAKAKWARNTEVVPGMEKEAGREIFRIQCAACHTTEGYNGLSLLVDGWDEEFIDHQVANLDTLKGYMPPFKGTDLERRALSKYLVSIQRNPSASNELRRMNHPEAGTIESRIKQAAAQILAFFKDKHPSEARP